MGNSQVILCLASEFESSSESNEADRNDRFGKGTKFSDLNRDPYIGLL